MWDLINDLGLEGVWLPVFVSLILIPGIYIALAIDAHKEYGEVVRASIELEEIRNLHEKTILLDEVSAKLGVFDLEWWLVGAFGVLLVGIMSSGYLVDWSKVAQSGPPAVTYQCQTATAAKLLCVAGPEKAGSPVRLAMSLYATLIGLLVGFRFGWARLKLAQDLKHYYVSHYRAEPSVRKRNA